jgi:hypothetical protein
VVRADHQGTGGRQDAVHLAEERLAVVHVVVGESAQRHIDRLVAPPGHRVVERVDPEVGAVADPPPRQLDHLRRGVAARHAGTSGQELVGVEARTAAGVEHTEAVDGAQQAQGRRAVVEGVVGRLGGVVLELGRERVVLRGVGR